MKKRKHVFALHWAGGVLGCWIVMGVSAFSVPPARAGTFTLTDENSTATIVTNDAGEPSGMIDWTVNDVDYLHEQAFGYRIGETAEVLLGTLAIEVEGTSDVDFDGFQDFLYVRYQGPGFQVEVKYSLQGGAAGSGVSDVGEQITVTSTADEPLDFHFFQYSDFDLSNGGGGLADEVSFLTQNTVIQTAGTALLSETVVTSFPQHHEAALYDVTRERLSDDVPTTLDGTDVAGPGDVIWAFQWDFVLEPEDSFLISKDKRLAPEPATVGFLAFGGLMTLLRRSKR